MSDTKTQHAIQMIQEVKDMFYLSDEEACKRLGITRATYKYWEMRGYKVSNRVYNRMVAKYNEIRDMDGNASLIRHLQCTIDNVQRQLDVISGK